MEDRRPAAVSAAGKRFIVGLFRNSSRSSGGEAHGLKHGHGRVGLEIGQEVLGGILLVSLEHGGGVDDLTAHLGSGAVHHRQTGGVGIGGIDDASVHSALTDLRGNLLHVVAVG